ncbi:MAG: FtsX-like permease family protein [Deltaproteobacteria bacterium]|nr:FtsX-like permease family protein [Deltaproteobacteria bacterium]PWB65769.1 MAG: ABC transporter permease [Deltaproteobacteria bacterium]
MNFVALKMLTADRAKYFGLIFAIAFASFLLANQVSIFIGIMTRPASQIRDVVDADIWVMDPQTLYDGEVSALRDYDLYRVRSVPGVKWAVPLYKGTGRAKGPDGKFRTVILMGLDDASLVGTPRKMLVGSIYDLRLPDAAIIDKAGYSYFFPGQPLRAGRTLQMNEKRVLIVGISDASAPFQSFPVLHTRYSQAIGFVGRERNLLSFVLAKPAEGVPVEEACRRIEAATGLRVRSSAAFSGDAFRFYMRNTGIPINFGITVVIALIVGTVVAGQTFYIFTIENLRQFGTLKAIGVTNRRIVGMILLQAIVVGGTGYALGLGMAAAFFSITLNYLPTRGIVLPWQVMAGIAAVILIVVGLASLMSIRRVLVLEPAVVFRS